MKNPVVSSSKYRLMLEVDLERIMVVEAAAYPLPWTQGNFLDCLKAGYTCLCLLQDDIVIGHGIMSAAAGEAHILNICIHPDFQRRGLGRNFMQHLLNIAVQKNADTAFLEVRASNKIALRLYDDIGFNEIGIRHGYYPGENGREDAIILALSLA